MVFLLRTRVGFLPFWAIARVVIERLACIRLKDLLLLGGVRGFCDGDSLPREWREHFWFGIGRDD